MAGNKNGRIREICRHTFLCVIFLFTFLPLYLMLNISLKDNMQFARNPWLPEAPFHWENFQAGWEQIGDKIFNTTFVAFTSVGISISIAIAGAFFFARFKMPGSRVLFLLFMLLMMYPSVANMVPAFKLVTSLGLYNTYWALIIPAVAGAQAFNIYVLRNFIEEIPQDLFDAAQIDGGNVFHQIFHIVIPMSSSVIGTLAVLQLIGQWNNFVAPLLYLRDANKQVIAVALLNLEGEYTKQWGELMAGYTIASIPLIVIFCFSMTLFVKGLTSGAVKG
jgi:multiple sugar transport system permease protein